VLPADFLTHCDSCHHVVPATAQRKEQHTRVRFVPWLAEYFVTQDDGCIGGDYQAVLSFRQCEGGGCFVLG
jgi:hypothetical protein